MKTLLMDFIREEARRRWHERWQQEVAHLAGAGVLLSPMR
jgi:hypothetical protein